MFSCRPHTVRLGLIGAILLLALALTSSLSFAAKGKGGGSEAKAEKSAQESEPAEVRAAPANAPRGRARGTARSLPTRDRRPEPAAPQVRTRPWSPPPAENRRLGIPREPAAPAWSRPPNGANQPSRDRPAWTPVSERGSTPYDLYRKPPTDPAPRETRRVVQTPSAPEAGRPSFDRGRPAAIPTGARENTRERERSQREEQQRLRTPSSPSVPPSGDRKVGVPRAPFRGPEADEKVRIVPDERQRESQRQLMDRLRDVNRSRRPPQTVLPGRDVVGNPIPANTGRLIRDNVTGLRTGYGRIRQRFGPPGHTYVFVPRGPEAYWDGYWDGYRDGRYQSHHPVIAINFYYPYYWSDPHWFVFYYPGYYPAIYHYWGWCPGWVHPARAYYVPVEYVYVPVTPYRYYYSGYHLDHLGARRAVEDVRRAWFDSEIGALAAHLTDRVDIRVYFDGKYEYSTSTEDYYAMTVDAMATTRTVAMDFDNPIWLSSHEVFYTARHIFYDPEGGRQQVYVSYRFRRLGAEWYIVAAGSSLEPIRHGHRDFRYR